MDVPVDVALRITFLPNIHFFTLPALPHRVLRLHTTWNSLFVVCGKPPTV